MTHAVLRIAASVFALGLVALLTGRPGAAVWCLAMASALTWWASADAAEGVE